MKFFACFFAITTLFYLLQKKTNFQQPKKQDVDLILFDFILAICFSFGDCRELAF